MKFNYLSDSDQDSSASEPEDSRVKNRASTETQTELINPFDIN